MHHISLGYGTNLHQDEMLMEVKFCMHNIIPLTIISCMLLHIILMTVFATLEDRYMATEFVE